MVDLSVAVTPLYFGTMAWERHALARRAEVEGPSAADYDRPDTTTSLAMGVLSLTGPITAYLVSFTVPFGTGKGRGRSGRIGKVVLGVAATAAVATSWLIARRAAAFGHHGEVDPRPEWALWAGCMIPLVNLVWAPVFVIELARAERVGARQRGPIALWWIAWLFSTAISAWAMWTRSATEPQGVADNTVTMVIAYLAGLVTLLLLWRVFNGFVRKPVDRPQHRWVVVAPTPAESPSFGETGPTVESRDREPAA